MGSRAFRRSDGFLGPLVFARRRRCGGTQRHPQAKSASIPTTCKMVTADKEGLVLSPPPFQAYPPRSRNLDPKDHPLLDPPKAFRCGTRLTRCDGGNRYCNIAPPRAFGSGTTRGASRPV